MPRQTISLHQWAAALMRRLASDSAGNTFIIVAAAILPMLALVGGAIDMGRSYLAETRLQQACDAGVLAARKSLGSQVTFNGVIPASVSTAGNKFFNLNFGSGAYGTTDRSFAMTLESDFSISANASAIVPTSIMRIFGFTQIPVKSHCEAILNYSNTDVMMVLDTTGSMAQTNPADTQPKIDILRQVVKSFHAQLEASASPGVRIRFGFVPYSTNVNVGYLLKSGWMTDKANYEGRAAIDTGKTETVPTYAYTYSYISGTKAAITPFTAASCPGDTAQWPWISYGSGTGYEVWDTRVNGISYNCTYSDGGYNVTGTSYTNYVYRTLKQDNGTITQEVYKWRYDSIPEDVSSFKGASDDDPYKGGSIWVRMAGSPSPTPDMMSASFKGCIEERDTYEIHDYSNVNLKKAPDLDIDLVPDPKDSKTQWRPMLHEISFLRSRTALGGSWSPTPDTTSANYIRANDYGFSACPAPAHKLAVMTDDEIATYVNSLKPEGSTYHDIGMIWGGRLISPTGIFAADNADVNGRPTKRHLIFLTDGQTAPLDLTYGTYGVEPLSQRRWSPSSPYTLTQTVENRFTFACNEVKKRNVTVWVIGFGTTMTDMLKNCAGDGHWFQADKASDLSAAFDTIAKAMGDLRISQ